VDARAQLGGSGGTVLQQGVSVLALLDTVIRHKVSLERLPDESPWVQFTSECQRFGAPPCLNK
jgi:hypothetical protein